MKKSLISLAVLAGMAASGAALAAGDAIVYGNVHLSLDDRDTSSPNDEIKMNSNTSAIGVKGSEDLGDGMKAIYKVEFQINPDERCSSDDVTGTLVEDITFPGDGDGILETGEVATLSAGSTGCDAIVDRDQWVGLKGGMGTVKFGTMSSNYKQKGGSVDPMYRTQLEGRGFLGTQSPLHSGAGIDRGRSTNTLQYSSPKMGGMQVVINRTFEGVTDADGDETLGVGFRYAGKGFSAYVDFISLDDGTPTGDESATKIGGTFKAGPVKLGAQLEQTEDLVGSDYTFLSANYGIDKNNSVALTYGMRDDVKNTSNTGSSGVALLYNHKMSKQTNVYVGYGDRDDDGAGAPGVSNATVGIRKKF